MSRFHQAAVFLHVIGYALVVGCGGSPGTPADAAAGGKDTSPSHDVASEEPFDGKASDAPNQGGDCFPPCIAAARVGCWRPTTGTCSAQPQAGGSTTYCYSNGVTELAGPLNKLHTFSKSAGQTCFSFEDVSPPASTTTQVVFRDAAGNEVARGTHPFATFLWTITCDSKTYTIDENSAACATVTPGDCTQGVCPLPH